LKFTKNNIKPKRRGFGEYNKNSASPFFKMLEVLRETAFRKHTYSHTTMGYLDDIKDYPNQYDYAWQFFNRFYRPENTTIIVVGDVKQPEVTAMVKKYWGDWKPGDYKQEIPGRTGARPNRAASILIGLRQTLPIVMVAYRAPAFSETEKDKAALDLLSEIAFGKNSELYDRLESLKKKSRVRRRRARTTTLTRNSLHGHRAGS
jgi:zinc protease